jgi:hypothetical protein
MRFALALVLAMVAMVVGYQYQPPYKPGDGDEEITTTMTTYTTVTTCPVETTVTEGGE